jgi:hypothetical protein
MAKAKKVSKKASTRKARESVVPENETKEQKFVRLAQKRVTNAVIKLRNIGKLSNRAVYAYSDEQVAAIMSALYEEVSAIENAFHRAPGSKEKVSFNF